MRALTLTLNPAVDCVFGIETLTPGRTFDARLVLNVPAGKGVNTARSLSALTRGRIPIVAAAWTGEDQARWFKTWLAGKHGIDARICARNGVRTRQAYTFLEATGRETHIKESGAGVRAEHERELLAFWQKTVRRGDCVALCGSAPTGIKPATLRRLFEIARAANAAAIIADTNGVALDSAGAAALSGIKGNGQEIGAWLGLNAPLEIEKPAHRRALLDALSRRGAPQSVLMTRGARGAVWASRERILLAMPPKLKAGDFRAATGCGDAATAGWIWALLVDASPREIVRWAVACGCAKLFSADPGGLDGRRARELFKRVVVREI